MGESYYDVLGVDTDATQDEITEAYRSRVLEVHPDRSEDPGAAAHFDLVTDARAVLSDDLERARYDRLGHDAYCRLESLCASASSSETTGTESDSEQDNDTDSRRKGAGASGQDGPADSQTKTGSTTTSNNAQTSSGKTTGTARGATSSGFGSSGSAWQHTGAQHMGDNGRGEKHMGDYDQRKSHHARHRQRRKRMAWLGADGTGSSSGSRDTRKTKQRTRDQTATDESAATESRSFRYAVHGWDGEITLSRPHRDLDRPTEIAVACIALLYPLLVYSSLSPAFWLPVNVVVGACTLVLVGYLLTMPRVAFATFGTWALAASAAIWELWPIDPVLAGLALAAFWIPFGYAGTVWWALRPR